jgi:hypothetical protein
MPPVVAAVAGAALAAEVGTAATAWFACSVTGAAVFGSTFATVGIGTALAGTITGGLAGLVVSTALNAVGSRLFSSNGATTAATINPARATMVRSTVETHKIVYGRQRVSGPIVFIGTTDSGNTHDPNNGINSLLHVVIAVAGHEIDSVETVYINESPVSINADGWVTVGSYATSGSANDNPYSVTTSVRTEEVVTVTTSAAHGFAVGDVVTTDGQSEPTMDGTFVVLSTPSGTTFTYANGGPNASSTGGSATDKTSTGVTSSKARIRVHTGATNQTADADLRTEVPGWSSNHTLSGIAYVYLRLQYDTSVFSQGIPNISFVVKGKKLYDPRDGTTAWSENVALCIRDYLASDYGFGCDADEINDTYVTAAANHCDEAVALTTGGTQKRYTCNGVLDTGAAPVENLNALVAAMAGTVTYVQGQFRPYAGVYDSTVGDIDNTMLAGPVKIQARTTRQQLFNAVKGTFVDPALNFQQADFYEVTNSTYETEDGGQRIYKDIQLPFTNHQEAAQRIGKLLLEQGRQGIIVEMPLKHSALPYAVWDTVTYTDETLGWDHKVFRIRKVSTPGIGPITLTLQEEASASYDWDSSDATIVDPAPDTNLPDPRVVAPVTGIVYDSRGIAASSGGTVFNLVAMWDRHPDIFVSQGGKIEIQYKQTSDTEWRSSFAVDGSVTFTDILSASVNVSYDVRIRARNSIGAVSDWSEIDSLIIGISGAVSATNDWGNWTVAPGPTLDWGNWTSSPGATEDWGNFT